MQLSRRKDTYRIRATKLSWLQCWRKEMHKFEYLISNLFSSWILGLSRGPRFTAGSHQHHTLENKQRLLRCQVAAILRAILYHTPRVAPAVWPEISRSLLFDSRQFDNLSLLLVRIWPFEQFVWAICCWNSICCASKRICDARWV
jgi:hypothetical protein